MFRLFKEIFKSLSKNKITVIGLSILIFLTTGIFTLLFSVKESYKNKIDEYKNVSKIQDATIDLENNFLGNPEEGGFIKIDDKNLEQYKKIYGNDLIASGTFKTNDPTSIRTIFNIVDKNNKPLQYIKLEILGETRDKYKDLYIKASDLKRTYESNLKGFNFDLKSKSFNATSTNIKHFQLFVNESGEEYKEKITLSKNAQITLDKQYKIKDFLVDMSKGAKSTSWFGSSTSGYAKGINRIGINVLTLEATLDSSVKDEWRRMEVFYELSEKETADLIGFQKESDGKWRVKPKRSYSSTLFNRNDIATDESKLFGTGATFLIPDGDLKSKNTNIKLAQDSEFSIDSYYEFEENTPYKLEDNWVYDIKSEVEYKFTSYALLEKDKFTGWYKSYIDQNPNEFKNVFSFWEKTIINSDSRLTGSKASWKVIEKITREDLTKEIFNSQSKNSTTIATIEKMGNEAAINSMSKQELDEKIASLNNSNIKDLYSIKLKNNVYSFSVNEIRNEIKKDEYGVSEIGERETITTSDPSSKKVFHFINSGLNSDIYKYDNKGNPIKQEVGKLYNESYKKSNLFIEGDETIRKDKIDIIYVPKILDAIFRGFIPKEDHFTLPIDYINVTTWKGETKIPSVEKNIKVAYLISSKDQKKYAINGETIDDKNTSYRIFAKDENDQWIEQKSLKLNNETLNVYLKSAQLELDAKISEQGWYTKDSNYIHSYRVPFIFRAPSPKLLDEIVRSQSVNTLFDSLQDAIFSSELMKEGFIGPDNLKTLIESLKISFKATGYYKTFTSGQNDQSLMQRMIFDTLYRATKSSDNRFVNNLINDLISGVISQIKKSNNPNEYIVKEINKVFAILKHLGIDSTMESIMGISPEQALAISKDPIELLEGTKNLVSAFDFDHFLTEIWEKWYKTEVNEAGEYQLSPYALWGRKQELEGKTYYNYFGGSDLAIPLVQSLEMTGFKSAISKIVNNIDFKILLDPSKENNEYKGLLLKKLANEYKDSSLRYEIENTFSEIFKKINSSVDFSYSNVNSGLIKIINVLDKELLLKTMESSLETLFFTENIPFVERFKEGSINHESKTLDVNFRTNVLRNKYLISGFISTLFKNPSAEKDLINALIEMLNLSSKNGIEGKSVFGIGAFHYKPVSDDLKVDLFSLQKLEMLSYDKFEKIIIDAKNIKNKLNSDFKQLEEKEIKFIKEYLLINSDQELESKTTILNRIDSLEKLISKIQLQAYDVENKTTKKMREYYGGFLGIGSQELIINSVQWEKKVDQNLSTISDYVYEIYLKQLTNEAYGVRVAKLEAKKAVDQTVHSSKYSAPVNAISMLNFWIKFSLDIQGISNEEKKQIFNLLWEKSTSSNSQIYKSFTNTKLFNDQNNYQPSGAAGPQDLQPIDRAITNPYEMAKIIFEDENPDIYKILANDIFAKEITLASTGEKHLLGNWIYDNRVELISALSQIAHSNFYHGKGEKYSTIIKEAINNNLLNDYYDDFEKLLLVNLSNKFSVQSKVLSSLGLNDTVASTYAGEIFPVVAAWFTTDPQLAAENGSREGHSNPGWILNNRLTKFGKIIQDNPNEFKEDIAERFFSLVGEAIADYKLENPKSTGLSIDLANIRWTNENILTLDNQDLTLFNINIKSLFNSLVEAATSVNVQDSLIIFEDYRGFVAKVNDGFLSANNKSVYTDELPKTYLEFEKLLNTVDSKYLLDIKGLKYLIVGTDSTADYLFPVISEEHLQVNTSTQALVYVNKYGFDRARKSNQESALKNYLLVDLKKDEESLKFADQVNSYLNSIEPNIKYKKAYGATEFDFINPERSMRVSTAYNVIWMINMGNWYIVVILCVLVAISTMFITKRYISTRNKVIGILRAQGYGITKIALSFTTFAMLTALIGGIAGYLLGLALQAPTRAIFASFWTIPTAGLTFSIIPFIATIIVPFLALSLIIVISAFFSLRKKPIDLMSGIVEINVGKVARNVAKPFRKRNIKNKFTISLAINSFWKLISLTISTVLTAFIAMFAISSNGVFKDSVDATYRNRNYVYKLDLTTPTVEGGAYTTFNKNDLKDSLYVPIGTSTEANTFSGNYFRPGWALINENQLNGNPGLYTPHIMTKSSLNVSVSSGLALSPWNIVYNSMPESQRVRTIEMSKQATKALELSQFVLDDKGNVIYLDPGKTQPMLKNLESKDYFKYFEDDSIFGGSFKYMKWSEADNNYETIAIEVSEEESKRELRNKYREFLIQGYKTIESGDFFIAFGGVQFNEDKNEKYSFMVTKDNRGNQLKVYGYDAESKYVSIKDANNQNLIKKLDEESINNKSEFIPIAINHVFAKVNNYGVGSILELDIDNDVKRYQNQINGIKTEKVKFKVIGIIDTYINNELVASRRDINRLIHLDELAAKTGQEIGFNGILSKEEIPTQTIASVGLYSQSGYWFGGNAIEASNATNENIADLFRSIFKIETTEDNSGSLIRSGWSKEMILKLIKTNQENVNITAADLSEANIDNNISATTKRAAINNFTELFGNNIYESLSTDVVAKDIEIGFVNNISQTVQNITLAVVIIFFIVAMIILIMISTMIIAENEKNIAIFSVLGYSNREKIRLFFSVYVPIILVSTLVAIPLVMGFIVLFNGLLVSSSAIVLALSLKWWHIVISLAVSFIVFALTSIFAWINLNKIKAIDLLKGK